MDPEEEGTSSEVRKGSWPWQQTLVVALVLVAVVLKGLKVWYRLEPLAPPRHRLPEAARLVPLAAEDSSWLGVYQLYTANEQLEFRAEGEYLERLSGLPGPADDGTQGPPPKGGRPGTWTRDGARVVVRPQALDRTREFELGRLDGECVLLTEVNVWRRAPDAVAATSSSR